MLDQTRERPAPEGGPRRRVVAADVARLAGVSAQTVSRVVNGHSYVSEPVADRVRRAISELGYRPNDTARALRARRSATIGVVALETALFGPTNVLLAVEQATRAAHFYLSVVVTPDVGGTLLLDAIERLERQGVAGILVSAASSSTTARALARAHLSVPIVLTERLKGCTRPAVGIDGVGGGRAATEHLLRLGHRAVWHVSGPPRWQATADRSLGWHTALKAARVEPPPMIVGDWSPESGYAAGQRLAATPGVSAVFVANDQMALGVISALFANGRRVPEDVSVVGFDDIPEAAFTRPPLTTIRQDFRQVGTAGLQLLLHHIAGKTEPEPPPVPTALIIRASTTSAGR